MDFLAPKTKNIADKPSGHSQTPEPHAEVWPLSTKPFFCVTLEGHHLIPNGHGLTIPCKLHEDLPTNTVPAKIAYGGKAWNLYYKAGVKRFESEGWRTFVKENALKLGDVCVFELTEGSSESSSIAFRVQFLKDDFPTELLEKAPGYLADNPISLD